MEPKTTIANCAAQTEFADTYQASVTVCGMCAMASPLVKKKKKKKPLLGVIS